MVIVLSGPSVFSATMTEAMSYRMVTELPEDVEQLFTPVQGWHKMGPESAARASRAYNGDVRVGDRFFVCMEAMKSYKFTLTHVCTHGVVLSRVWDKGCQYLACRPIRGPHVNILIQDIWDDGEAAVVGYTYEAVYTFSAALPLDPIVGCALSN